MEIYVIRHTPVAVGKQVCYGQLNVPLANTFKQDIEYYKKHLPCDFDIVYSSPLQRCNNVAQAILDKNIELDNSLLEMNFGDWEGKLWNEIDEVALDIWMQNFVNEKPPNGENLQELFNRVALFFDKLRNKQYSKVLVVCHAGVIRCLWAYLLKIPLENIFKLPVAFNEIFICKLHENEIYDSIKQIK